MSLSSRALLSGRWATIKQGKVLSTPSKRKTFEIVSITPENITIKTEGETEININRAAFMAAIDYLQQHNHFTANKVRIGSNKVYEYASHLCRAIRDANGANIMISTYVIPILAEMGLVGIDCSCPNRTWIIQP